MRLPLACCGGVCARVRADASYLHCRRCVGVRSDPVGSRTWSMLCEQSDFVQQITAAGKQATELKRDRVAVKVRV